jgi:hypothetical protein
LTRLISISFALFLLHGVSIYSQVIEVVCHTGHNGENQLDTRAGTFRLDRVSAPDTTTQLTLTREEKLRVLSYADSIGFFDYPHELTAVPVLVDSTYEIFQTYVIHPCSHYMLLISAGDRQNQVTWDNCLEPQDKRHKPLDELVRMIIEMVMEKPAYKALPRPIGFYQ